MPGAKILVDGVMVPAIAGPASTTGAADASELAFTPTGTIAATDVQAAIAEVASEASGGGSNDYAPATPNAKDDEFDGTSSVTWVTTPTAPAVTDVNSTYPGALYIKTQNNSSAYQGRLQAVPGSYPYGIAAKISDLGMVGSSRAGLVISEGTAGTSAACIWGWVTNTGGLQRVKQLLNGSFVANGYTSAVFPPLTGFHLRMYVRAANSIDLQFSLTGRKWVTVNNFDPTFTPSHIGVFASSENAGAGNFAEVAFDYFRVT